MKYKVNRSYPFPVIEFEGRFASRGESRDIRESALRLIDEEEGPVILDLSRALWLEDLLLGLIVHVNFRGKKQDKILVLAGPNERVGAALQETRLGEGIPVLRTVEDAVAFLEDRPHTKWVHGEEAFKAPRDRSDLSCVGCGALIVILLGLGVVWLARC
jgi:anti-anti-sigma regulatory factor